MINRSSIPAPVREEIYISSPHSAILTDMRVEGSGCGRQ